MWEICTVEIHMSVGTVHYWSWPDAWRNLTPRDYLAQFYPEWLQKNPKRTHADDVITVLLGHGWEPYAYVSAPTQHYCFRREVDP